MRAFSLLLIAVVALLAIRWFRPEPAEAAEERLAPSEAGVRFLPPPGEAVKAAAPAAPTPVDGEIHVSEEPGVADAWPANLLSTKDGAEDEVRVAAALLHGTPAEVQAAAASFPKDRALLLESFSWAAAGERKLALSLSEKIEKESVDERERVLFEAVLTGRAPVPAVASVGPVALAMEMSLLARQANQALLARRYVEAAGAYSRLLIGEIGAPWPAERRLLAEWTKGLDEAQREHRWHPRGEWPAAETKIVSGDTLIGIRLRYLSEHPGAKMCTGLIERANRIKGLLQPNQVLRIPTEPVRVVVDLGACWALFFIGDEVAAAWPIGIGRPGEETPVGSFTVRNKLENPPWMKEGQDPIPFGDPRNPLGTRWIGWDKEGAKTSYGFHGTWDQQSIGQAASDGCVRFLNSDVEQLFQILPEGAPIVVQG